MQELHEQVKQKLQASNNKYKQRTGLERRKKIFKEGELVMAHLRKEQFPKGTYNKLKYKKIRPCRILKKISIIAYKLELLNKFDISPTFNVVDLYEFHTGENGDDEGILYRWEQLPVKRVEEVEGILATRICRKTRDKEYLEYLVKWKNREYEDASWVSKEELIHL
jgi:hypothetical protein